MSRIPIAVCGKSSSMAESFASYMLPEYEVVHHFSSTSTCATELPALLHGDTVKPDSGTGTNSSSSETQIPQAVMVGAGFSEPEFEQLRKIEGAEKLVWLYPDPLKSAGSMLTGPFLMRSIASRVKSALQQSGVGEEGNKGRRDVVLKF